MLQQDMTGYIQGALNAGVEEAIGIMVDYVDQGLTQFLKDVVTAVSLSCPAQKAV
jgi:leucyl aminopeptidase